MMIFASFFLLATSPIAFAIMEGPVNIGGPSVGCKPALSSTELKVENRQQVIEAAEMLKLGIPTVLLVSSRDATQLRAMLLHLGKEFPGLEVTAPGIFEYGLTVGLNLRQPPSTDAPSKSENDKIER